MKKILLGAFGTLVLGLVAVAVLLQAGVVDVSADTPHSPAVHRLVAWAREQSIMRRAADIVAPADLADASRIRRGAGNYDAMCVNCHLSPGVKDSEIRKGLYPTPPKLAESANGTPSAQSDARRFWIVKHGIKASGMPAWSKGGMNDEAIWDLTAFLKALPNLTPETYRSQVEASEGHSHGGLAARGDKEEKAKAVTEQQHDTTPHTHRRGANKH